MEPQYVVINIIDMTMLLKQSPLTVKRKGDPEQLSKDWEEYIYIFNVFLEAAVAIPAHAVPEVADTPYVTCKKMNNLMILIGGTEVKTLFNHVRKVTETETWNEALEKISRGIRGQTSQAMARFKLMQRMPQNKECFMEWYPHVRDQAEQCTWAGL